MKTTDYLDALRAHYDLPSDYALAKKWGCTRQFISKYRSSKHTFDDTTSIKVANWLNIDPAQVLTDMHAERSKTPEVKAAWESITKRLTSAAAAVLLAFVIILGAPPSPVLANVLPDTVYYVKSRARTRNDSSTDKTLPFYGFIRYSLRFCIFTLLAKPGFSRPKFICSPRTT